LDGHHRWKACKELGISIDCYEKKFPNNLDEKEFIIEVNLRRRHLNEFQRGEMGLKLESIYSERAKERNESTKFTPKKGKEAIQKRWKIPHVSADTHRIKSPRSDGLSPTRSSVQVAERVRLSQIVWHSALPHIFSFR
jgi:hypothetical protein